MNRKDRAPFYQKWKDNEAVNLRGRSFVLAHFESSLIKRWSWPTIHRLVDHRFYTGMLREPRKLPGFVIQFSMPDHAFSFFILGPGMEDHQ